MSKSAQGEGWQAGEPFVALNELAAVYGDHPEVVKLAKQYKTEFGKEGAAERFCELLMAMSKTSRSKLDAFGVDYLREPFTSGGRSDVR